MSIGAAQVGISLGLVAGSLGIDHVLEGQHMGLEQVSDGRFGQVGVGAIQERAEVLGVVDQVGHGLVLLGLVLGGRALRVVDKEADVRAPQGQEGLLGIRAVHTADCLGNVD